MNLHVAIEHIGLSEKAAKVYLAALELGEATVQDLGKHADLRRTTLYYVLPELLAFGALLKTKRGAKLYYLPEEPRILLKRSRERVAEFEDALPALEERKHAVYERPRVFFLYGPSGFKRAWELIFANCEEEYLIITPGENFLDFVSERYVVDEIIKEKRRRHLRSRQLITDSPYARQIIAKDFKEGRVSKLLPPGHPLLFTEIVATDFVAFISPRSDNLIMVVENGSFAATRRAAFDILWGALP